MLFWQIQTGLKQKIEFIRVAANWRCVVLLILPGWKSKNFDVEKSSTTHGTLSWSLTDSLPMFLRVKVTYAFFRSVLSQLFRLPSFSLHMCNSISRKMIFFLTRFRGETWRWEDGKIVFVDISLQNDFTPENIAQQIFLCAFVAKIGMFIQFGGRTG